MLAMLAAVALLLLLGACITAGPELTEAEAIQIVNAYLQVKIETPPLGWRGPKETIPSEPSSCANRFRDKSKFKATWNPQPKTWLVTYAGGYAWTVYEKTRVVELPPPIDWMGCFGSTLTPTPTPTVTIYSPYPTPIP